MTMRIAKIEAFALKMPESDFFGGEALRSPKPRAGRTA